MLDDQDREWMAATMRSVVAEGVGHHVESVHTKLDERHDKLVEKVDDTRKHVWIGAGIITALSALWHKIVP